MKFYHEKQENPPTIFIVFDHAQREEEELIRVLEIKCDNSSKPLFTWVGELYLCDPGYCIEMTYEQAKELYSNIDMILEAYKDTILQEKHIDRGNVSTKPYMYSENVSKELVKHYGQSFKKEQSWKNALVCLILSDILQGEGYSYVEGFIVHKNGDIHEHSWIESDTSESYLFVIDPTRARYYHPHNDIIYVTGDRYTHKEASLLFRGTTYPYAWSKAEKSKAYTIAETFAHAISIDVKKNDNAAWLQPERVRGRIDSIFEPRLY